jgi:polyisoprenoid-binding protein YceI
MNRHILAYRRLQLPAMPVRRPLTRMAPGMALIVAALSLSACQWASAPRAQPPPATSRLAAAAPAAAERYRIDADACEVLILIYRDGRLASLGHNHIVAVRQLSGEVLIAPDSAHSSWQLDFPVDALSVDEPQLRAAQGEDFQTKVDDVAIAGTREHMLGTALLDAARFPVIHLQSEQARAKADGLHMDTRIVVREHTAQLDLPVALERTPDELIASGEFDLTHAELGLTPYSVALGALRVAERMHVRYRLVARRQSEAPH